MTNQHYVIVVAEDNKIINELLTQILEDKGYSVISCFSGEEAYRVAARLKPDVVITDVSMEVEDAGFRLLERLRTEATTAHIGVIVCSANKFALDTNRSIVDALGARLVRKPFDLDYLYKAIEELLPA